MITDPKYPPKHETLSVLIAVEQCKNFVEAGELINKSDKTVSARVGQLERLFQTKLVNRPAKGGIATLTRDGKELKDRAVKMTVALKGRSPVVKTIIDKQPFEDINLRPTAIKRAWQSLNQGGFEIHNLHDQNDPLMRDSLILRKQNGRLHFHAVGQDHGWRTYIGGERTEQVIGAPCATTRDVDHIVAATSELVMETGEPTLDFVQTTATTLAGDPIRLNYHRLTTRVKSEDGPLIVVNTAVGNQIPHDAINETTINRRKFDDLNYTSLALAACHKAWLKSALWTSDILKPLHNVALCVKPINNRTDLCVCHLGVEHGSSMYFGKIWQSSMLGQLLNHDDLGNEYNNKTIEGYFEVLNDGNPVFDTILGHGLPVDKLPPYFAYHRLLLRCIILDGSEIIVNVATRPQCFFNRTEAETYLMGQANN